MDGIQSPVMTGVIAQLLLLKDFQKSMALFYQKDLVKPQCIISFREHMQICDTKMQIYKSFFRLTWSLMRLKLFL